MPKVGRRSGDDAGQFAPRVSRGANGPGASPGTVRNLRPGRPRWLTSCTYPVAPGPWIDGPALKALLEAPWRSLQPQSRSPEPRSQNQVGANLATRVQTVASKPISK